MIKQLPALLLILVLLLTSCSNENVTVDKVQQPDTVATSPLNNNKIVVFKASDKIGLEEGFAGIYEVPEMLALCVKDSAPEATLAQKYATAFTTLENELNKSGVKSNGAPGSIAYNNNPANFVFECVFPINKVPKKQPKNCQIVILESSIMFIYNYYGEYASLHEAYAKIKDELASKKLVQNGPMREFYITDPVSEKDAS
jgi:effector-binding domain-containing protein